ncbi:MAG TPA: DMT family transporter [Xanthobacteraceae bacterium]|nr:DMT family transporter [Xanthobacteraceae bacterium]
MNRRGGHLAIVTGKDIGRVLLWMTGALLSFTTMAVSVRELASALNVFEMLSIRSAFGLSVLLCLALLRPSLRHLLRTRRLPLHGLRNVIHFGAQVGWAQGVVLLPLATVFALEFTTPIWVAVLAVLILGEQMTASRAGTVLLGFLGVLVILRPGMGNFDPAALLVLGAALGFAATSVATKALTGTDATYTILLYMNLFQLPLNLMFSDPLFPLKLGSEQALPVLGMAVSGLASHYCLTNAFRSGDALIVIPLDFLRIPLIAVVGWLFYGEGLEVFVFLGAGLIVAGILWNLLAEARTTRAARPVAAAND